MRTTRSACFFVLLSVFALGGFAASAPAQYAWFDRSPLPLARYRHAMAFDVARGCTVLFGGMAGRESNQTWELHGAEWVLREPATRPPVRQGHAMAYDAARQRVVLFGGYEKSTFYGDTWEWDGVNWTQVMTTVAPAPRGNHALAYDAKRRVTLLFGGSARAWLDDTWEWDGNTWQQRASSVHPNPRRDHALAYDLARGKCVLFGGFGMEAEGDVSYTHLGDTWEWDGSAWSESHPNMAPSARAAHALAYDVQRQRCVLYGGADTSVRFSETWEWDGLQWALRTAPVGPQARSGHRLAYDLLRKKTILFGGEIPGGYGVLLPQDTWEWDGTAWVALPMPPNPPPPSRHIAYDSARQVTVLFGSDGKTWEWDGVAWSLRNPATKPRPNDSSAITYDEARRRVVLYVGSNYHETWEWDGIDWKQLFPSNSPTDRVQYALAYDAQRQRVVLFGGWWYGVYLDDTWEWDGSQWTQANPIVRPRRRRYHAMTYDPVLRKVLLFGGYTDHAYFNDLSDTWVWDGVTWLELRPSNVPFARSSHGLAADLGRQRVVLFGGKSSGMSGRIFDDVWEWNGSDWVLFHNITPRPVARSGHGFCYDVARGRCVAFGSDATAYWLAADTWEYASPAPAHYLRFGSACAGLAPAPMLSAVAGDLPWIGANLRLEVGPIGANTVPFVLMGTSRTAWGALTLPLSLDSIGMPGCKLFADPALVLPMTLGATHGSVSMAVPQSVSLLGQLFFQQGLVADPSANALGLVTTNAAEGRIGAR